MCAIVGILSPNAASHRPNLERMVGVLKHRGPDADGIHIFPNCALGHARLSIIDRTGGRQPMFGPGNQTALVFNGEIYGYQAIRSNLRSYTFRSGGDTEVVLALYEHYSTQMMQHLPGMFAFALWDEAEQTLFCARDRFGEKPFYYATAPDGTFVFASEIKGIIASGLIEPQFNPSALFGYLRRGYISPRETIYHNIHSLPPAHQLILRDGQITISRYWNLPAKNDSISLENAVTEFRERFSSAVSKQLVADVAVGAFLSGGLDSSTIVAEASKNSRCVTFSFGFGNDIDELPYAREIARRYNTVHHELKAPQDKLAELLMRMQLVYDEPFGDSSNIPTYLLSGLARKHITVALAGEGGDELTAGYGFWYRPLNNFERSRKLPQFTATLIRAVAATCKIGGRQLPKGLEQLREGFFMQPHFDSPLQAHRARTRIFSDDELKTLDHEGALEGALSRSTDGDTLDSVLRSDLENYLPGDILTKTDRASMAQSLEMRCPFLDVDFASFCISLPTRLKIDKHVDKLILREAYQESWTDSVRKRAKQGFGAPVAQWLKRPDMVALKQELLNDSRSKLYSFLPFEPLRKACNANDQQTWLLLVLAAWLHQAKFSV